MAGLGARMLRGRQPQEPMRRRPRRLEDAALAPDQEAPRISAPLDLFAGHEIGPTSALRLCASGAQEPARNSPGELEISSQASNCFGELLSHYQTGALKSSGERASERASFRSMRQAR